MPRHQLAIASNKSNTIHCMHKSNVKLMYTVSIYMVVIVPYELSAECIIVKLSAYSILDDNRKIPIDCGKCHVKNDVTVLLT